MQAVASGVSPDQAIYSDYIAKGRFSADLIEMLCRRIYDDGIDDALEGLRREKGPENFVGFMGASSNKRSDPFYSKTAETARLLTQKGFFVVSGGGPGMMEAANFGAYLAKHTDQEFDAAIKILKEVEDYSDIKSWIAKALEVKAKFGKGCDSLGIPTWFYGFEPTNMFAMHVAKYFDNSIREYTPMIFLGKQQYAVDTPVYPLLQMLATGSYKDLLFIGDEPEEVLKFIQGRPPVPKAK